MIGDLAPYIGFVLVTVIFTALTKGSLLSANNLQSLSNQIIVTALVTLGAVFVFGAGFFDMSMGGTICFAAVMGGVTAVSTGNLFLAALVIFAVSLIFGVAKGLFAAYINIPFFIFTIVLGSVISAVVLVILGSKTNMNLSDAVRPIPELTFTQMSIVNVVCLILFFLLCLVLFNYTSLGLRIRNMGGNMTAARQSGISTKKTAIEAFLVSSLGVAVAAFIILIRTRSVSGSTAGSVGTDVMVALVLGGMPLSGGTEIQDQRRYHRCSNHHDPEQRTDDPRPYDRTDPDLPRHCLYRRGLCIQLQLQKQTAAEIRDRVSETGFFGNEK
jgi:ribose transport system permease protein